MARLRLLLVGEPERCATLIGAFVRSAGERLTHLPAHVGTGEQLRQLRDGNDAKAVHTSVAQYGLRLSPVHAAPVDFDLFAGPATGLVAWAKDASAVLIIASEGFQPKAAKKVLQKLSQTSAVVVLADEANVAFALPKLTRFRFAGLADARANEFDVVLAALTGQRNDTVRQFENVQSGWTIGGMSRAAIGVGTILGCASAVALTLLWRADLPAVPPEQPEIRIERFALSRSELEPGMRASFRAVIAVHGLPPDERVAIGEWVEASGPVSFRLQPFGMPSRVVSNGSAVRDGRIAIPSSAIAGIYRFEYFAVVGSDGTNARGKGSEPVEARIVSAGVQDR